MSYYSFICSGSFPGRCSSLTPVNTEIDKGKHLVEAHEKVLVTSRYNPLNGLITDNKEKYQIKQLLVMGYVFQHKLGLDAGIGSSDLTNRIPRRKLRI